MPGWPSDSRGSSTTSSSTALAYYYRGAPNSEIEQISANMILGNTLLTAEGIPAAGEGDLKTAIAMKIMHELGYGGSFCEFAAMDLRENFFLFGHDGPAHTGISDGTVAIRELKVFHGKAGGGLSVEMRAQIRAGHGARPDRWAAMAG